MYKPKDLILTAGPSVSQKEIAYVADAVKNGWNKHYRDYTERFEKVFAEHIGVKHALTTSGGTGALWLSLAALDIGPGDEVILPEITYFACSDVIMLLGAKPVFVDILPDTWCIDPEKIEKAITKKTKAIMPVDIYGNPVEMDEIKTIADKHHIPIVEDACPAAGTLYKGRKMGGEGTFGAYSFQGAKIMVTGFGGMLLTNDDKLFKKVEYLNSHGEDPGKKFWQTTVGYTFEMTNMQAAFGLAQLERLEEFVNKKRQIFDWYHKRMGDIEGISMNKERKNTKSNRWMSSIILDRDFNLTRDEVKRRLKEKYLVDTRPFFYPISMFPMYEEQDTPVAHHVGLHGINLPSGLALTEEIVDYVASSVRKVLKA